jgi:hypothetical protein
MQTVFRARLTAAALLFTAAFCPEPSLTHAATVHFLVAEQPEEVVHGDSYVLPLNDPADIAHARSLITAPAGTLPSIAIAKVAPGADGINRDHRAAGTPAWNWHVTEFESFADFSAEILDGWPTFVEQDVPGWMANTNRTIGFWSYTVVAELPAVPEPATTALVAPLAITGWSGLRRRATRKPPAPPEDLP